MQLSPFNEGQQTGVTGALDFNNIIYNTPVPYSSIPVGHGDCIVWSESAKKIQGTITITITFAPSPSAPGVGGGSTTLTVQAAGAGQYKKIVLTTSKLGWYDSATIGVTDNEISADVTNISVDGTGGTGGTGDQGNQGGNNGGQGGNNGGQMPPITSNIILNANMGGSAGTGSVYQIYNGLANLPEVASPSLGIFLAVNPPHYLTDIPADLAHAYVYNTGTPYGNQVNNGEIVDMGAVNLITNNNLQGPPTTGFSFYTALTQGHSYVVRYRKVLDYQTSPLPLDYNYGIFYVNSQQSDGVTITYQGPFTN